MTVLNVVKNVSFQNALLLLFSYICRYGLDACIYVTSSYTSSKCLTRLLF